MNNMEVKRISIGDEVTLGAFFEAIAADPEAHGFFHPHLFTIAYAQRLCLEAQTSRDRYYLWRWKEAAVAYVMLRGWDEGYDIPSFGCCVHPKLKDCGLGKMSLAFAIQESNNLGAPALRLTVYKKNVRAVHIYGKFGFSFSEKNPDELVGILHLPARIPQVPPPNESKLDQWRSTAGAL